MAAYSGWGLAEFWKARKDFPRQKWARKSLPGKWTRGHEGTEGSLSCWQPGSCARVLADSAGRAGCCHTRCCPPPEQSFS